MASAGGSLEADDGQCRNFHRSVRARLPSADTPDTSPAAMKQQLTASFHDFAVSLAHGRTRKPINKVKAIAWGACVICALAVVGVAAAVFISSPYLLLLSGLAFIGASAVAWGAMVEAWVQKRSRGRLTQGPAPGVGSRASQRTRPAAEAEQLPPINHGQQEQAEAVQNSLPRRQRRPISRPPRQWRPRGLPTARRTIAVQLARVMSGQSRLLGSSKSAAQQLYRPRSVRFPS